MYTIDLAVYENEAELFHLRRAANRRMLSMQLLTDRGAAGRWPIYRFVGGGPELFGFAARYWGLDMDDFNGLAVKR